MSEFSAVKKYYIIGVSGTGKSTLSKALKERGILAIDLRDVPDHLCWWRNKKTKQEVEYSSEGKEWLEDHERVCDPKKLKDLLEKQTETVVITGVASGNQDEYLHLFDKVFLLICKPEIILLRLAQRSSSSFAKTKEEQEEVIKWQKTFDPHMLTQGAISINNDGSVNEAVEQIIAKI